MSKSNSYFLIARNRLSNQFQVLSFDGKRGHSLEEIDLFTTSFKDSYDLEEHLLDEGVLTEDDTDFFIASQSNVGGKKVLVKQEALYSIHSVIRDIAKNSQNKDIAKSENLIDHILDSFADKLRRSPVLYEQVVSGQTNIYDKYAKYFIFTRQNLASIKYREGGWARTSYPLIRNVIEASSRRNTKYMHMSDVMYRSLLDEKLLQVTDPNYDPNQLSMFDTFQDLETVNEDKLLEVMSTFDRLPANTILIDDHKAFFNPSAFFSYEGNDLEKLMALPQDLLLMLRLFLIQRDCYVASPEKMGASYKRHIQQGQKDMIQLLKKHPDVLDRAYAWCSLYHKYEGKAFGDVHGREYQKRREDEGTN